MRRTIIKAVMLASAMIALNLAQPLALATDAAEKKAMTRIKFIIGTDELYATLDDTASGRDFAKLLPLELTLSDYHGIEKIADLPRKLDITGAPASFAASPGDITLYAPWGNLAIFYKSFPATSGLIRLGAFDGPIEMLLKDGKFRIRIEQTD